MLSKISLAGYKSIASLEDFEPGRINVLIGVNGAGKSNLLSFFRMLQFLLTGPEEFGIYLAKQGGASKLLYGGPTRTARIKAKLAFLENEPNPSLEYQFQLEYGAGDSLVQTGSLFRAETNEGEVVENDPQASFLASAMCPRMDFHQVQNTSGTSRVLERWPEADNLHLKHDAGNLAPFLLRLRDAEAAYYRIIRDSVRRLLPFFDDFVLEPEYGNVLLRWKERGSDVVFGASQASDGMLRLFALVALLQQPPNDMAKVLILDEPELGLHPAGIEFLGGLIRSAAAHTQFFVATQSPHLVDCFEPEAVIVVERKDGASTFTRHSSKELEVWLEEYSMGDIWRKNLVGGRP